jgi:hypothetical protein
MQLEATVTSAAPTLGGAFGASAATAAVLLLALLLLL